MGLFDKMRTRREQRAYEEQQRAHQEAVSDWMRQVNLVQSTIDVVEEGGMTQDNPDWNFPFNAQKGETLYAAVSPVSLVEPRRLRGQWQGGTQGVSIRIMKGVSYRVGATRGTYQPGPEVLTTVDQGGSAYITSKRVIYLGNRKTLEWKFPSLLGYQHDEQMGATFIQVSNRQKVSGILYGPGNTRAFELRLAAALAQFNDRQKDYLIELRDQMGVLEQGRPEEPAPPPT